MNEYPEPSLVVLVGASGAGKSTWAAELFRPNQIVSLSQLKGAVGHDEDDPRATVVAYELLERIVDVRLEQGLTVVIDTPGLDDGRRSRWRTVAGAHSIPPLAVLFTTAVEACLSRNETRRHPQPATIIKRQAARCREIAQTLEGEGYEVREVTTSGRHGITGASEAEAANEL